VDLPVSDIEAAIEKEFGNKECKYFKLSLYNIK